MALPAILSPFVAGVSSIRGDHARLLAKCLAHDEVAGLDYESFPAKRRELTRNGPVNHGGRRVLRCGPP